MLVTEYAVVYKMQEEKSDLGVGLYFFLRLAVYNRPSAPSGAATIAAAATSGTTRVLLLRELHPLNGSIDRASL